MPFPSPGDLPDPGMGIPALAGRFFSTQPPRKPHVGEIGDAFSFRSLSWGMNPVCAVYTIRPLHLSPHWISSLGGPTSTLNSCPLKLTPYFLSETLHLWWYHLLQFSGTTGAREPSCHIYHCYSLCWVSLWKPPLFSIPTLSPLSSTSAEPLHAVNFHSAISVIFLNCKWASLPLFETYFSVLSVLSQMCLLSCSPADKLILGKPAWLSILLGILDSSSEFSLPFPCVATL